MKIESIETFIFLDETQRKYFIVKVETDDGITGLGEVGIGHWGGAVQQAIQHLGDLCIGADPLATERLWQRMFRRSFFPADRVYSCAISAIDIALWDIKGKALGLPVYRLLGGPVREKVVCYPHNRGASLTDTVESCSETTKLGWKFARFDLPADLSESNESGALFEPREAIPRAVELISAIKEAVGDDVNLCIDVHTRLDMANAVALCKALEPFNMFFIEDPLRSENPASYRTLAHHVSVPIAAGEQWSSKWGFREVIENELINYARIDLCIAGGLTEALKIAHWCETHYIDIVPHNPLGPVSAAAGVALCMSTTNVGVQEMPRAPGSYAQDLFPKQLHFEDGYAAPREEPGLGIEFNEALALERPAPLNSWPPEYHRRDGSYNNW